MSRTYAHTPHRVNVRRAEDVEEVHNGCEHDPSGDGRIVGYEWVEVVSEPHWQPRTVIRKTPWGSYANGVKWVYEPTVTTEPRPIRKVVPCDINGVGTRRGCYRYSDKALTESFGYHHKCHWGGMRRDRWYLPERQSFRQFARRAADEYNTYGDVDDAVEPFTRSSPSGLWGGGWID